MRLPSIPCLVILAISFLLPVDSYSQPNVIRLKKNVIELYHPIHKFPDAPDFPWLTYFPNSINAFKSRSGIAYKRVLSGSGHALGVSFECFFIEYPILGSHGIPKLPGDIYERKPNYLTVEYLHPLIFDKKLTLWLNADINFRTGWENSVILSTPQELFLENRQLKDLGLGGGATIMTTLPYNFILSAEASYYFFPYIYDKGDEGLYPYDPGSSNRLLTMRIVVGYQFDDFWMRWVKKKGAT